MGKARRFLKGMPAFVNQSLQGPSAHWPVLHEEVASVLGKHFTAKSGEAHLVDCTFGTGGHSLPLLRAHPHLRLSGIDLDPRMISRAEPIPRVKLICANFKDVARVVDAPADGFILDLGYNSIQLEDPAYGLSYSRAGTLDMRYSPGTGRSASELLNTFTVFELSEVFSRFGEVNCHEELALAVEARRRVKPFADSQDFADLLRERGASPKLIAQAFQAIRIAVNDELENLRLFLDSFHEVCAPGALCCVITFHSLEREVVDAFIQNPSTRKEKRIRQVGRPVKPSADEVQTNSRSKAAQMFLLQKREQR